MKRICAIVFSIGTLGFAESSNGQSVEPGPATPVTRPAPPAPAAPEKRVVSSDVASMLSVGMPKFAPPKPAPKPEEDVDMREVDKPKNGIVRLPKLVVHPEKPLVFRDRNIYTKDGLKDYVLQHYHGLGIMPFSSMNSDLGKVMYYDDVRQQAMGDLQDTADAMRRGGDSKQSDDIKRWSYDTYSRGFDWGAPTPTNPSARSNPGIP